MRCLFIPKNLIFRSIFITFGCNIQIVVTCLPYYFVSKVQLMAYRRLFNDPVRRPHKRAAAECADDVVVRRAKRLFHIVCRRKWDCRPVVASSKASQSASSSTRHIHRVCQNKTCQRKVKEAPIYFVVQHFQRQPRLETTQGSPLTVTSVTVTHYSYRDTFLATKGIVLH